MYFLHLIIRKHFCHACIFFVHDGMSDILSSSSHTTLLKFLLLASSACLVVPYFLHSSLFLLSVRVCVCVCVCVCACARARFPSFPRSLGGVGKRKILDSWCLPPVKFSPPPPPAPKKARAQRIGTLQKRIDPMEQKTQTFSAQ